MGTKNILGITTTVQCVAPTVDYAVRRIRAEILPRFPAVDDVVAITHSYGCGVAIGAPWSGDTHPHHPQSSASIRASACLHDDRQPGLRKAAARQPVPQPADYRERSQHHPDAGPGRASAMHHCPPIMRAAETRLEQLSRAPAADLCRRPIFSGGRAMRGSSDAFSGVTCNRGGRIRSRSPRPRGRDHHVLGSDRSSRRRPSADAARRPAGQSVRDPDPGRSRWYDEYLERGSARAAAPIRLPATSAAGCRDVVEKALGSVAKSGRFGADGSRRPWRRRSPRRPWCSAAPLPRATSVSSTQQLACSVRPAPVHDGRRNAIRTRRGAGDQDLRRTGGARRAMAGFDRPRRPSHASPPVTRR